MLGHVNSRTGASSGDATDMLGGGPLLPLKGKVSELDPEDASRSPRIKAMTHAATPSSGVPPGVDGHPQRRLAAGFVTAAIIAAW